MRQAFARTSVSTNSRADEIQALADDRRLNMRVDGDDQVHDEGRIVSCPGETPITKATNDGGAQ
jgi:hypothetical protein